MSKHDLALEVLKRVRDQAAATSGKMKAEADGLYAKADAAKARMVENDKAVAAYDRAIAKLSDKL